MWCKKGRREGCSDSQRDLPWRRLRGRSEGGGRTGFLGGSEGEDRVWCREGCCQGLRETKGSQRALPWRRLQVCNVRGVR